MTIAEKLKEEISSRGITYTFISEKTNIPVDTLSKVFLNQRRLLADEMLKICEATSIDLNVLKPQQQERSA